MDRHLSPTLYALAVVVLSLAIVFIGFTIRKRLTPHQLPLPPGPRGLPYLGNAFQIKRTEPWVTYREWKKEYGEIVSCKVLGQTFIILNSDRVAKALLDQRSNIYSDRPAIRTSALFGMEYNTGHLRYGDTWRSHRRMLHQTLNSPMIPKYYDSLTVKARAFLVNLLHDPQRYDFYMRAFGASVIMSITYGHDVALKDDPFLNPIEETNRIAILMTPERALVLHIFPQLLKIKVPSWFPGAELQQLAKRCRELSPKIRDAPVQFVKDCLAKGIENNSMVAQLLQDETIPLKDREAYEQNIKDCATSGFIAGNDTTQATLLTLTLALLLYPEVQDRAHELLDRVVGRDRLPTFNDRPNLQYIDAIIRETLRWGSLVPMAVPHMVTQDDIFEGHLIPKGAVIIPNAWGIARDEENFPDPSTFKPERHLDADGNLFEEDTSNIHFGFGRRICPGRFLADASVFISATNMLSVFKISKAIGPAGYEIDVFPKFTSGVAIRPVWFPCRFIPRFEGAKELILE